MCVILHIIIEFLVWIPNIFIDCEQEYLLVLTAYIPFYVAISSVYFLGTSKKIMTWSKERFGSWFLAGYIEIKISLLDLFRGNVS